MVGVESILGPRKIGVSTQIKSISLDLGTSAGVTLRPVQGRELLPY
jgi:hypothetical protein